MFDAVMAGMVMREMDNIKSTTRANIIAELRAEGILLPQYDWNNSAFVKETDNILNDWFARHPETKRGTGEFVKKYPKVDALQDTLVNMSRLGRITPEEYVAILKEAFNF